MGVSQIERERVLREQAELDQVNAKDRQAAERAAELRRQAAEAEAEAAEEERKARVAAGVESPPLHELITAQERAKNPLDTEPAHPPVDSRVPTLAECNQLVDAIYRARSEELDRLRASSS